MKLNRPAGVIGLLLLFAVVPVQASTLALDVNGALGPVLGGSDRLGVTGLYFTLSAVIDQNSSPIRATGDSATYSVPGNLEIELGNLILTGYNATLTLTDPGSGPDVMSVAFGVTEFNFTPDAYATLSLPAGTLDGTGLQDFWAYVSQPGSSLSYFIPGVTDEVMATLGVTGTASLGGTPSGVPEPGTIGLLAGGLLAVALKFRRRRTT